MSSRLINSVNSAAPAESFPSNTPARSPADSQKSEDAFGLVLSIGAIQPIWQLQSLYCYHGTWRDNRNETTSEPDSNDDIEIVLTIATGTVPQRWSHLDPKTLEKLRKEWKLYDCFPRCLC